MEFKTIAEVKPAFLSPKADILIAHALCGATSDSGPGATLARPLREAEAKIDRLF